MEEQEKKHYLSILVEQDLYRTIRAIREGNFQNEKEMIVECIQSFERSLPDIYKQISNYHDLIIQKIKEIDLQEDKLRIIREQDKKEKEKGIRQQEEK